MKEKGKKVVPRNNKTYGRDAAATSNDHRGKKGGEGGWQQRGGDLVVLVAGLGAKGKPLAS